MANIVYKEKCPPLGSCPNKSHPLATAWMQKPQGGGKFLVQIYGCAWGEGGGYGWNWYLHNKNVEQHEEELVVCGLFTLTEYFIWHRKLCVNCFNNFLIIFFGFA